MSTGTASSRAPSDRSTANAERVMTPAASPSSAAEGHWSAHV